MTSPTDPIPFASLPDVVDLHVDAYYAGGNAGNTADDPISKLIPKVGNQGGFRRSGRGDISKCKYVVLYSDGGDPDWPDHLDEVMGQFVFFGDNKKPGCELHDTSARGNTLLAESFKALHSGKRRKIPPFLIFTKGAIGRDVVFRGLAVPGAEGLAETEDLVAVWRSKGGQRFQNYRSTFTVLDVPMVPRLWLEDLQNGIVTSENAPAVWQHWCDTGVYKPLRAQRTIQHRTKSEQLPNDNASRQIVEAIRAYFKSDPYAFEPCASEIFRLSDRNVVSFDLTRRTRDGGRDAVGKYRIGQEEKNAIDVEFALEAKCYSEKTSVGVEKLARLISRLRHRQFGVLVTTSYLTEQAYSEMKEDGHPIIVISACDIVKILRAVGFRDKKAVQQWLQDHFPKADADFAKAKELGLDP